MMFIFIISNVFSIKVFFDLKTNGIFLITSILVRGAGKNEIFSPLRHSCRSYWASHSTVTMIKVSNNDKPNRNRKDYSLSNAVTAFTKQIAMKMPNQKKRESNGYATNFITITLKIDHKPNLNHCMFVLCEIVLSFLCYF